MIKLTGDSPSRAHTPSPNAYVAAPTMIPRPFPAVLIVAVALAFGAGSTWAAENRNDPTAANRENTLPASVRRIERETGGQVLKAQPIQRDGREVYRVKVVTPQGRVRVMEDDSGWSPTTPAPVSSPPPATPPPSADRRRNP